VAGDKAWTDTDDKGFGFKCCMLRGMRFIVSDVGHGRKYPDAYIGGVLASLFSARFGMRCVGIWDMGIEMG
jgi:hypothetical protein